MLRASNCAFAFFISSFVCAFCLANNCYYHFVSFHNFPHSISSIVQHFLCHSLPPRPPISCIMSLLHQVNSLHQVTTPSSDVLDSLSLIPLHIFKYFPVVWCFLCPTFCSRTQLNGGSSVLLHGNEIWKELLPYGRGVG